MRKGSGKDELVVIDSYTMREITRFNSIIEAKEKLSINPNTIYVSIHTGKPAYDCYWVYAKMLATWKPATLCHRRTKSVKVPTELQKIIEQNYVK